LPGRTFFSESAVIILLWHSSASVKKPTRM
jgi:hypothetical protein